MRQGMVFRRASGQAGKPIVQALRDVGGDCFLARALHLEHLRDEKSTPASIVEGLTLE